MNLSQSIAVFHIFQLIPKRTLTLQNPLNFTSATTAQANDVKIYLYDDTHMIETVYRDIAIMRSTKISLPFQLTGNTKGHYRIVRNGVTIMEKKNITSKNVTK